MASRVLADHNGGVSEKVFFDFDKEYSQLKSQASTIAGKMRALKKRGEEDGLDVQEYEYQRKRRMRPLEERRKAYENGRLYLKFWKDPLGAKLTPIEEFSDEVGLTEEQRQQKWEDEGYVAGREGKNRDACPHPDPNSLGARYWMAGYDRGQAANAAGIKKKPDEAATDAPKKRGRPSKAEKEAAAAAEKEAERLAAEKAAKTVIAGGEVRVTYWHDVKGGRVLEINDGSMPPKGAENLTKPEFLKLQSEYKKKEEDDWNSKASTAANPDQVDGDEDDEDEAPPASGDEAPPASATN